MTTTHEWDLSDTVTGRFSKVGAGGSRVDVIKEVPAPIREKLESLLKAFDPDKGKSGTAKYEDWNAGTPERAKEFEKLAKRYGKYRPEGRITVRAQVFDETWVHFTAKPLEQRNGAE